MTEVRTGRSRWWAAGLVLATGLLALAYFLLTRPDAAVLPAPAPTGESESRATDAARLLDELVEGLEGGDRAQVTQLAARGNRDAARELADLYRNVQALGITGLSMRYVDEHVSGAIRRKVWTADVRVDWRLGEYDDSASHLEVTMTFRDTPGGAAFVTARRSSTSASPLWILDRVHVTKGRRTLVIATAPGELSRFSALADQAVRDVHKVLPGWQGDLVVEVPADQDQLTRVLGATPGSYASIAAVTASVDGSSTSKSVRVFINPPVFAPLGDRGAQIVMSHEATHVATGAASSRMPTWLLEGFADYVALAHVDLPVEVTASQILEVVRREGAPHELPDTDDFQSENPSLGASYESAWLACRLIADTYGEPKLLQLYQAVERSGDARSAFRSILDRPQSQFTADWRRLLERLARR